MLVKQILFLVMVFNSAFAVKLSDYTPYNYDVLFTNPDCREYKYDEPQITNGGSLREGKKEDVYCKYSDASASGSRTSSPQHRILKLIHDRKTKEIFMAYLSFSNSKVGNALCNALKSKNLKLTVVIDASNNEGERAKSAMKQVTKLQSEECHPQGLETDNPNLKVLLRGHTPGIGYAHDKLMIINPSSTNETTIVFSSGNMSSGVVLHHENWNFVKTNMQSYFAQVHLCLKEALINHYQRGAKFRKFIRECRQEIQAPEETDIKVFFVPGEGDESMAKITEGISKAKKVDIAAHRFSAGDMIDALTSALERTNNKPEINLVVDDDIYWIGRNGYDAEPVGHNNYFEFAKIMRLFNRGMNLRYMETNHSNRLLHHNKFIVFTFSDGKKAVHTGAGNFTTAAFTKNLENFYYITIPEVVEVFDNQYKHLWDTLSTRWKDMPETDVQI